jgi:hypothetical protein
LSKESYCLCKYDCESEEEARAQQRAGETLMNKNEVGEGNVPFSETIAPVYIYTHSQAT